MNTFIISSPVEVDPCPGAKSLTLTECSVLMVEMHKSSSRCISQHLSNHIYHISYTSRTEIILHTALQDLQNLSPVMAPRVLSSQGEETEF